MKQNETNAINSDQYDGAKEFVRAAIKSKGKELKDEDYPKILEEYGNDYTKLVDGVGQKLGVTPEDAEAFRKEAFAKYKIPQEVKQATQKAIHGYDAYDELVKEQSELKDQRAHLEGGMYKMPEPIDQASVRSSTAVQENLPLDVMQAEQKAEQAKAQPYIDRIDATRQSIESIDTQLSDLDKRIAAQREANLAEYGYETKQVEYARTKAKETTELLKQARQNMAKKFETMIDSEPGVTAAGRSSVGEMKKHQEYKEAMAKVKDIDDALNYYKKIYKELEAPTKGDKGIEGLVYGLFKTNTAQDFFSLGLTEMSASLNVKNAFDQMQKEREEIIKAYNYDDSKTAEEHEKAIDELAKAKLTAEEQALLDVYMLLDNAQKTNNPNWWVNIGAGIQEMLPFIAQFAATGGTANAAGEAVKKLVAGKIDNVVASKVAGRITRDVAQTALMFPTTLDNYAERVAPEVEDGRLVEGESQGKAFAKSFLTTYAEVFGESAASSMAQNFKARMVKMLANEPNKAQEFLAKLAYATADESKLPSIQGGAFEVIGEEITGIMQAIIDNDASFFTADSQLQLLTTIALFQGGTFALETPSRVNARQSFNQSKQNLLDNTDEAYAEAIIKATETIQDPDELQQAIKDINSELLPTQAEYITALRYYSNAVAYGQMRSTRAVQVYNTYKEFKDDDGNITTATYNGEPVYVTNTSHLANPNSVAFIKKANGEVKAVRGRELSNIVSQTEAQLTNNVQAEDELQEDAIIAQQEVESFAAERGFVIGKTIETPNGKGTLQAINPDGTITITNRKGEEEIARLDESEPYYTSEQKAEMKAAEEAQLEEEQQAAEEVVEEEVIEDTPEQLPTTLEESLPYAESLQEDQIADGIIARTITFKDGRVKTFISDKANGRIEGEDQVFNSIEEAQNFQDAYIKSLQEEQAETPIEEMTPVQQFEYLLREVDDESAAELMQSMIKDIDKQIKDIKKQADKLPLKERVELFKQIEGLKAQQAEYKALLDQTDTRTAREVGNQEVPHNMYQALLLEVASMGAFGQKLLDTDFNRGELIDASAKKKFLSKTGRRIEDFIHNATERLDRGTAEVEIDEQEAINTFVELLNLNKRPTEYLEMFAETHRASKREELQAEQEAIEAAMAQEEQVEQPPVQEIETLDEDIEAPFRRATPKFKYTKRSSHDFSTKVRFINAINELTERFGVPIEVMRTDEAPAHIQYAMQRSAQAYVDARVRDMQAKGATQEQIQEAIPLLFKEGMSNKKGVFDPRSGRVMLFSDTQTGVVDAKKTYLHEVTGHYGLHALFNGGQTLKIGETEFKSYNDLMDYIYSKMTKEEIAKMEKLNNTKDKHTIADEHIAYMAEKQEIPSRWAEFMNNLRRAIRKLMNFSSKQFTEPEMLDIISASRRNLERGGRFDGLGDKAIEIRERKDENLVVMHNLNEDNLIHADKMGGLPVPSLAIARTDKGFYSFGNISLIADKYLIDPSYPTAKTYNSDIYSPRYPSVHYNINHSKFADTFREANEVGWKYGLSTLYPQSTDIESRGAKELNHNETVMLQYLIEQGKRPRVKMKDAGVPVELRKYVKKGFVNEFDLEKNETFIADVTAFVNRRIDELKNNKLKELYRKNDFNEDGTVSKDIIRKEAYSVSNKNSLKEPDYYGNVAVIRDRAVGTPKKRGAFELWVQQTFNSFSEGERIFKGYTPSGNRRYIAHTLENVVKELKGDPKNTEGVNYGIGSVRGASSKQFKNIEQIQRDRDKIVDKQTMEALKEEVSDEFSELMEELKPYHKYDSDSFQYYDNAASSIGEYAKGRQNWALSNIDKDTKKKLDDFIDKLKNMPTEYFESKVQRAVRLDEFVAAVVPNGTSKETLDILEKNNIKVKKYNPNKEGDRAKKVDLAARQNKVRFRTKEYQELTEALANYSGKRYDEKTANSVYDKIKKSKYQGWNLELAAMNAVKKMEFDQDAKRISGEEYEAIAERLGVRGLSKAQREYGSRFRIADTFYSPTERALDKIQQNKGTVHQFQQMLLKNGAKQAEIDWMGLKDHFGGVNVKVTKQDIQDWISQNKIEIEEVEKEDESIQQLTIDDVVDVSETEDDWYVEFSNGAEVQVRKFDAETEEEAKSIALEDYQSDPSDNLGTENTRYSDYQLPGGGNYKELLLTMPQKDKFSSSYNIVQGDNGWNLERKNGTVVRSTNILNRQIAEDNFRKEFGSTDDQYRSSHFDEKNILAHIRMNERTDAEGNRVLFIEELQSDWAQEGRKKGFKSEERIPVSSAKEEVEYEDKGYYIETDFNQSPPQTYAVSKGNIPQMPFKKTDQWLNLAMRRVMRYAAEHGFDKVAWTTGEQQADRYSLSKVYRDVNVTRYTDGTYGITASYLDGSSGAINRGGLSKEDVLDYIGKDASNEAFEVLDKNNKIKKPIEYKIQNLSVEGEGMKSFYNSIVPKAANKLGKPFKAKAEVVEIDGEQQLSLPVTEKMRESVIEQGVPMFRIADSQQELDDHIKDSEYKEDAYHATDSKFKSFIPNSAPGWGSGVYFSDNKEQVRDEFGDNVYTVKLNIKKPFNGDYLDIEDDIRSTKAWKEHEDKIWNKAVYDGIEHKDDREEFNPDFAEELEDNISVLNSAIRELGYDAIIAEGSNNIEGKEIVVFNNDQILIAPEEDVRFRQDESIKLINTNEASTGTIYETYRKGDTYYKVRYADHDSNILKADNDLELDIEQRGTEEARELIESGINKKKDSTVYLDRNSVNEDVLGFDSIEKRGGYMILKHTNKETYTEDELRERYNNNENNINQFKNNKNTRKEGDLWVKEKQVSTTLLDKEFYRRFPNVKFSNNPKELQQQARQEADTNPTEAQKEAGNYKKGHIRFDGFDISIENPKGSNRSGKDADGKEWSRKMPVDYGYFKGTVGNDKDHIDVFLGDKPEIDRVYIVDQTNKDGSFDEHKVLMGFGSIGEAKKNYRLSYEKGWKGLGAISTTDKAGLKEWFKDGDMSKPYSENAVEIDEHIRFRQTETPEFKEWFGDSKVVDEDGRPLVVYHGTASDFNTFSKKKRNFDASRLGYYFTSAPKPDTSKGHYYGSTASEYADYASNSGTTIDSGSSVMPVYLSISNPLIIDSEGEYNPVTALDKKVDELRGILKGSEYDGVIVKDSSKKDKSEVYVVFKPNQIKSATGNTGAFSKESDDIRFRDASQEEIDRMKALFDKFNKQLEARQAKKPQFDESKEKRSIPLSAKQATISSDPDLIEERSYNKQSNDKTLYEIRKMINKDGLEKVVSDFLSGNIENPLYSNAVGIEIYRRLNNQGRTDEAINVLDKLSEDATLAGQSVQILSLLTRMNPEGQIIYIKKQIDKANEAIKEHNDKSTVNKIKPIEVTEEEYSDMKADLDEIHKLSISQEALDDIEMINNLDLRFKGIESIEDLKQFIIDNSEVKGLNKKRATKLINELDLELDWLKARAVATVYNKAYGKIPETVGQKISTYQAISHLLNPKTFLRNIISNKTLRGLERVTRRLGGGIDGILAKSLGTERVIGKKQTKEQRKTTKEAAKIKGDETSLDILLGVNKQMNELDKYRNETGRWSVPKLEELRGKTNTFKGDVMGAAEKMLTESLVKPDEASKEKVRREYLNEYKNLTGLEPDAEIIEEANQMAKYMTFQDDSWMSDFLTKSKVWLNTVGINGFGLGDLVIKYTKVPGNVIARTFDYSPIGLIKALAGLKGLADAKKKGEITREQQMKVAMGLSRGISGSAILALGFIIKSMGIGVGDDEENKAVEGLIREAGLSGDKLNLSAIIRAIGGDDTELQKGDILANYDWLQPIGSLLKAGGTLAEDRPLGESMADAMFGLAEIPSLYTIKKMADATVYGDETGASKFGAIMSVPFVEGVGGFVPAPIRQVSNIIDPVARDTYSDGNAFERAGMKVAANIPGLRQQLKPRIRPTGEEKSYSTGSIVGDVISQINPSTIYKYSPSVDVDKLSKLSEYVSPTTRAHTPLRFAPKSLMVRGQKVKLNKDQKEKYMKAYGAYIDEKYNEYLNDVDVDDLSDRQAEKIISKLRDINKRAKSIAKREL